MSTRLRTRDGCQGPLPCPRYPCIEGSSGLCRMCLCGCTTRVTLCVDGAWHKLVWYYFVHMYFFFLTAEQRNTFLGRVSFTLKSLIHQLCIFYLQTKKIAPVNLLLLDLANPSKKSYACTCLWNTCLKKLVNPDHLTTRVTVCWWCQAQVGLILFRSHVLFFLTAEQRNTFLSWVSFPVKSLTHPLCIFTCKQSK